MTIFVTSFSCDKSESTTADTPFVDLFTKFAVLANINTRIKKIKLAEI